MHFKKTWAIVTGTVLVTGMLATGAAFAANSQATTAPAATEQSGTTTHGKQHPNLTPGQTEVLKQIGQLRKNYMEQFRTDAKATIEKAVKDGKITQQQADDMLKRFDRSAKGEGGEHNHHRGDHRWSMDLKGLTQDQVKAKLDAAVKEGKLTQAQADKILNKWQEHQAQR